MFRSVVLDAIRALDPRHRRTRTKREDRERARAALLQRLSANEDFTAPVTAKSVSAQQVLQISYAPAYRNPYQVLFYGFQASGLNAQPRSLNEAQQLIGTAPYGSRHCFHQHWLNEILPVNISAKAADARVNDFVDRLTSFKTCGGLVAWTLHNLVSHESPHPEIEAKLSVALGSIADVTLVHGLQAADVAQDAYGVSPDKLLRIEHGSYRNVYPDHGNRVIARKRLGVGEEEDCFLFLGFVRPYKGVTELVPILSRYATTASKRPIRLIVAGEFMGIEPAALALQSSSSLRLDIRPAFVPDDALQDYAQAADFMVLPFRRTLTSGSAILSLSFGLPVIAPASGSLTELIADGSEGFLYAPDAEEGLASAVARALGCDAPERSRMRERAKARAARLTWAPGRRAFVESLLAAAARLDRQCADATTSADKRRC